MINFKNKKILITGATGGIGKALVKKFLSLNGTVLATGTNIDKLDSLKKEFPEINILKFDISEHSKIEEFIENASSQLVGLDVLINNAGVFPTKLARTDDGFEAQFGVNHLAHFLLTIQLLDLMKASAPARIITVTSKLHKNGVIDFESFKGEKKYSAQLAYGQSKLANVLFAVELAERLKGTAVTSNLLHPGAVRTDIMRQMPKLIRWLVNLSFISVEEGAKTSIMLASDQEKEGNNGEYYDQCELDTYSETASNRELRERLWNTSLQLIN